MSDRQKRRSQRSMKSEQSSAARRSGKAALKNAVDNVLYASEPVDDFADDFEDASTEVASSAIAAPAPEIKPAFRVSTIDKDRYWPKPVDTSQDWGRHETQLARQTGLVTAEREGVALLLTRKGGAFNAEGTLRAESSDVECGRKRHITAKSAMAAAAIADLQDIGFATGQARHMIDPKRGSRSRGFDFDA